MASSVAVLSDIHGVLPALDAVLAEPAVRDAWAILYEGAVEMRRTAYDPQAACAQITDSSSYPDVAEWAGYFLYARATDADALAAFGPRDGRMPKPSS
jgi:hypothetical protein